MIEKLLEQSAVKNGFQVSFILNSRILTKAGKDWVELKGEPLSVEEWEDLKDICLQGNEKVQLETKGYISGVFELTNHRWKFSFTEKKDCFRAHLSLVRESAEVQSHIENPLFWETVKKNHGLFIIAGERGQGKTSLVNEIVKNEQFSQLKLVGIHSTSVHRDMLEVDNLVQLGSESIEFDSHHSIYEGIERLVVDMNNVKSWKKWIEMAEQGAAVLLTVSSTSVLSVLMKIGSEIDPGLLNRFSRILNGIVVQKLVGSQHFPCSEIFILKDSARHLFRQKMSDSMHLFNLSLVQEFKETYQSMNQALIQKLIRRKIDVQSAFEASDDPETLDQMLKKMGL